MSQARRAGKLRIGIVGAGAIVRDRHLPGLSRVPDVEIAAVCNSSYESSQRFCREHAPHATPIKNWADLLMLSDLDIIWIGTPPYLHAEVTVSALEAWRHVFCQARMAMDLGGAQEMLEAANQKPELVTMLCPPPHGMKGDRVVRRLLSAGAIGEVRHLHLQSLGDAFLDPTKPAHWRQRSELSGLNVLTLGIYAEVLDRWIGPIHSVRADGRVFTGSRGGYPVTIPDMVGVLCEFQSGAVGVLEFSGVAAHAPADRLEVYGSEGKLVYDFGSDTVMVGRVGGGEPELVPIPPGEAREWTVERDFIAAVRNPEEPRPHPTFEDGVRYMRVVQAVADAIASGERIKTGT